ncbi:hypothetical protein HDU83_006605 [Entophlyctis luteolus]|nr:hypothetical protein HDU82_007808 [Entophlyctis luteolus]KAJ3341414.1 hypothetical protein HDU83_006605 [Entophlyctis luteolus]
MLHVVASGKPKKKGVRAVQVITNDETEPDTAYTSGKLEILKASAFSTAESYNFVQLLPVLQRQFTLMPFVADDVYHIRMPKSAGDNGCGEAFFFGNGVFVTWGVPDTGVESLLRIANDVGEEKYDELEVEWFDYVVDTNRKIGIYNDIIIIGSDLPEDQCKLAFSSGLARSAKLASLENLLEQHLDKSKDIPELLQQGKRLPLGRHAILKNIGELFALRGHVNLHSELLDLPDFCWSSSKMEEAFSAISKNLDVGARISIFNKKLDYANELSDVLRNHLHEEHSLKLEWIIIALISIAVVFETVNYVESIDERKKTATQRRGNSG